MLTLAGLFLGYLTFLILSPAIYWGLRRVLPAEWLHWTLYGLVGNLSRNLSLVAVALLVSWAMLGRGSIMRRAGVAILGGTWIWIAYFAGLMKKYEVVLDPSVAPLVGPLDAVATAK